MLLGRVVEISVAATTDLVDRWLTTGSRGEHVEVLDDMRDLACG